MSAREFVAWYNGLPGAESFAPNLAKHRSVAIVGQGNVAVDVARILLSPVDQLRCTDITAHALAELAVSDVQKVYLIGRRGPMQVAFTIKELREMTKLPGTQITWRSDDFLGVADGLTSMARPRKRLTELMLSSLAAQQQRKQEQQMHQPPGLTTKQLLPIFLRSPKEVSDDGQLTVTINRLASDGSSAVATNATETIPSDLVMRSIGYKAVTLDADINFNEPNGFVNNHGGMYKFVIIFFELNNKYLT